MSFSEAISRDPKRLRPAITAADGDPPAYPSESESPTVYPIIFLDATFTEEAGAQELETTERADAPGDYAFAMMDYIPEGTEVLVAHVDGRWYVVAKIPAENRAMEIVFTADADFGAADATITVSVVNWDEGEHGGEGDDPDPESAGLEIENGAGNLVFSGAEGATGFARWKPGSGKYRTYQMECPMYY
jgi:hypothetical protein